VAWWRDFETVTHTKGIVAFSGFPVRCGVCNNQQRFSKTNARRMFFTQALIFSCLINVVTSNKEEVIFCFKFFSYSYVFVEHRSIVRIPKRLVGPEQSSSCRAVNSGLLIHLPV